MNCPAHKCRLLPRRTRFGVRWSCPVDGCTVACWGGDTSTPADEETRKLRHACHGAFDRLWDGTNGPVRFASRSDAYAWLREFMGLSAGKAHIGMFDREQCLKLLGELEGKP